jgi:hypothetical protein
MIRFLMTKYVCLVNVCFVDVITVTTLAKTLAQCLTSTLKTRMVLVKYHGKLGIHTGYVHHYTIPLYGMNGD